MLETIHEDKDIVFINQLFIDKQYSRQRFSDWKHKFKESMEIMDTIKKVEDVLESRLVVGGLSNKLNVAMAIFVLKNKYMWSNNESHTSQDLFGESVRANMRKYFK